MPIFIYLKADENPQEDGRKWVMVCRAFGRGDFVQHASGATFYYTVASDEVLKHAADWAERNGIDTVFVKPD